VTVAEESKPNSLELRVQELENQLQALTADEPVDISAEELAAYKKVARAVGCGRCGRGCTYCIALATTEATSAAVACRCGRGCGYPCGYPCGVCIVAASEELGAAAGAVMPCVVACARCGRGCSYCIVQSCIAAASEEAEAAAVACSRGCGRVCGRGCSYCIAAAGVDDLTAGAMACRCGRGCGYCYGFSSADSGHGEARVLGQAGAAPIRRFGNLGK